jgi:hypothetical protein
MEEKLEDSQSAWAQRINDATKGDVHKKSLSPNSGREQQSDRGGFATREPQTASKLYFSSTSTSSTGLFPIFSMPRSSAVTVMKS